MRFYTEYLTFNTKRHRGHGNMMHHQIILPVTDGRPDLGSWQQVYYAEFDGKRKNGRL